MSLVDQHKLVYAALAEPLADGTIHELRITTKARTAHERVGEVKQVVEGEQVALFMKGTPQMIMCGNSHAGARGAPRAGAPVTAVDVLPDPAIRQELSALSGWPTIPQVFVKGELIGGADITEELEADGELEQKLDGGARPGLRGDREEKTVSVLSRALRRDRIPVRL